MNLVTYQDAPHSVQSAAVYEKTFMDPFVPSTSDVFIAVMGMTGAGKSTFISHCTDEEVAISDPGALQSCTQEVRMHRCKYFSPYANVYLVDTPGFDDTNRKDTDILKEIASWLTETYQQKIRLRGILYLHRISDNRMGGCAHRNLSMFKKLCGHEGIKSVIFLTTFWEKVDEREGDSREQALKTTDNFWGFFVKRGARVRRHRNTRKSALSIVKEFAPGYGSQPAEEVKLAIQTEMVDSGKNLDQTSAGQELESEIKREREKLRQEMREREEEMKEAMEARDKEMIEILKEEQEKQNEQLKRRDAEMQDLKISMERMHEEKIQRLEARFLQQQEEYCEYRETMNRMQQQHQETLQQLRNERVQHESRMDVLSRQINDLKSDRSTGKAPDTTKRACSICQETFTSADLLSQHLAEHLGIPEREEEEWETEPESDTDAVSNADSVVAVYGNGNVNPYLTCLACKRQFDDRDKLFEHIEAYQHGRSLQTGKPEPYIRPAEYKRPVDPNITCLTCKRSFYNRNDLFRHIEQYQHGKSLTTGKPEFYKRLFAKLF